MRIGRYHIKFGTRCWIQTNKPTEVRCILGFIWIFRIAKSTDIDKRPRYNPGTPMVEDGKVYRYVKMG